MDKLIVEIKYEMKKQGITQKELSKRTGYSEVKICGWFKDPTRMRAYHLLDILDALNLDLAILTK